MPLRLLSLNVFGVFHAADVPERMAYVGAALAPYDVVCLQEQFTEPHFEIIRRAAPHLPHTHRYRAGGVGSGLTILSKYPLSRTLFVEYRCQSAPERFWEGDFFANKGVAVAQLQVPRHVLSGVAPPNGDDSGTEDDGVTVTVLNTHLVAQYGFTPAHSDTAAPDPLDENAGFRVAQAAQLAQLTALLSMTGPVIVCGDLNSRPRSAPERAMVAYCQDRGAPIASVFAADSVDDAAHTATWDVGITYNAPKRERRLLLRAIGLKKGPECATMRLDHIYLSSHLQVEPGTEARVVLKEKVPRKAGGVMNMSDHYGIAASLVFADPCSPLGSPASPADSPLPPAPAHGQMTDADARDALIAAARTMDAVHADMKAKERRSFALFGAAVVAAAASGFMNRGSWAGPVVLAAGVVVTSREIGRALSNKYQAAAIEDIAVELRRPAAAC